MIIIFNYQYSFANKETLLNDCYCLKYVILNKLKTITNTDYTHYQSK